MRLRQEAQTWLGGGMRRIRDVSGKTAEGENEHM